VAFLGRLGRWLTKGMGGVYRGGMTRPSLRDFFANWSASDAPTTTKLRQAVRNSAIKLRTGSSCCGNHGQPGC
jgi:hypothetical protein